MIKCPQSSLGAICKQLLKVTKSWFFVNSAVVPHLSISVVKVYWPFSYTAQISCLKSSLLIILVIKSKLYVSDLFPTVSLSKWNLLKPERYQIEIFLKHTHRLSAQNLSHHKKLRNFLALVYMIHPVLVPNKSDKYSH